MNLELRLLSAKADVELKKLLIGSKHIIQDSKQSDDEDVTL